MTDAGIDTAALASSLSADLGAAVVDAEVLHDGVNLSVRISTADGTAYVLRRPNALRGLASFNGVAGEYGVLERLRETPIPAPEPVLVREDASVLGDPFLVMTFLEGESVPLGADLPGRFREAEAREAVATRLVDTLADIHSVDPGPFADVCDRRPLRAGVERAVDQFEAATEATGHDPPGARDVVDWLRRNVPPDAGTALVHGDYRPSNVLLARTDRPKVAGVLDWETAFLGDPLTDLGYLLLRWRDGGDPTPPLDGIGERHPNADAIRELEAFNERGMAPFTAKPGSPSRRELVARYENRAGTVFEHDRFYRAFAAFGLAAVWENLHRHRTDPGKEPYVEYMLLLAESVIGGEFPL